MISKRSSSARSGASSKSWTSTTRRHRRWCLLHQHTFQDSPAAAEPILYPAFPVSDQALFETALLQTCDALDGVADGVIDNLPACRRRSTRPPPPIRPAARLIPCNVPGPRTRPACLRRRSGREIINTEPRTAGYQAPAGAVAPDHVDNTVVGYAYDGGFMTTVGIPARKIGTPTSPPGNFGAGTLSFPYAFISPPDPTYYMLDFNFDTDTAC